MKNPHRLPLGYNPIASAIHGILTIEAGLLTPPFDLLVYRVNGAIFRSSIPYWIIVLQYRSALTGLPAIAAFSTKPCLLTDFNYFKRGSWHGAITC